MKKLLYFDPLIYLGINNVSEEEKTNLCYLLLEKISEYIFIRSLELLPVEKGKSFTSLNEVFFYCQKNLPAYNEKVLLFLEDFRKEYSKS